jgi:hypothetical protein
MWKLLVMYLGYYQRLGGVRIVYLQEKDGCLIWWLRNGYKCFQLRVWVDSDRVDLYQVYYCSSRERYVAEKLEGGDGRRDKTYNRILWKLRWRRR